MADEPAPNPDERDMLAAELALGILEGDERARALRLQMSDAGFRAEVAAWQGRLEPLLDDFGELAPPDLWRAIELRLAAEAGGSANVAAIRQRLRTWRLGALVAGAAAAAMAGVLVLRPAGAPPTRPPETVAETAPSAVARLGAGDAAHQFAVNYNAASGELRIRTLKLPPSGLAPELWVIPADNVPRSLGLVAEAGSTRIVVAPALRALMTDGATLAITLEKREGAPHKAPTSSPVAAGPINSI